MASKVEIANLTVQMLGEENTITALTEKSKAARAINGCYDIVLDRTIRGYNWNCAMSRATIGADVAVPAFGYTIQYTIPGECLRMVQVGTCRPIYGLDDYPSGQEMPYQIEGRKILTDLAAPLPIRFLVRITDPALMDASLINVFACNMAIQTCKQITGSNTQKESLKDDLKKYIREAKLADAIENPPEPGAANSWLMARI